MTRDEIVALNKRIVQAIHDQGLTIKDFCEKIGVARSTFRAKGYSQCGGNTLFAARELVYLGVDVNWLLFGDTKEVDS